MEKTGITMGKFIAGIVIAILVSSAVSVGISTLLIKGSQGPEGPQGEKGETGATGATGPQGPYLPDYDSGWIDITDDAGQFIDITHNLNTEDVIVDIRGKTTASDGANQRYLGLTGNIPEWTKTYGGTDDDIARSIVQASDGGYALAGETYGADFWLVKTDSAGTLLWNKTYGGVGGDYAYSVVETADGGYALTGTTNSFGAGGDDFWLVKTDSAGNHQWNKTYGGTDSDECYSVVQTSDGGYAMAGSTLSAGRWDSMLVKTDSAGNHQWNKTYGGIYNDATYSVVETADGGYALTGYARSYGAGGDDFWLVKTDSTGTLLWNKTYGGANSDRANSMVQTGDGGYALAGSTQSYGVGTPTYENFWLVKTDSAGNQLWTKTYGGAGTDTAYSLVQASDGGYAMAGRTESSGAGLYDFWLVKTNVESGLAWTDSTANTITLYRGATDIQWNYVRVRIWKID